MFLIFWASTVAFAGGTPTLGGLTIGEPHPRPGSCYDLGDGEGACNAEFVDFGEKKGSLAVQLCHGKVHKITLVIQHGPTANPAVLASDDPKAAATNTASEFRATFEKLNWKLGPARQQGKYTFWSSGKKEAIEAAVMLGEQISMPPLMPEGTWAASAFLDPNVACQ